MNEILQIVSRIVDEEIDFYRFLIVGNSFGKRSVFLYANGKEKPLYVVKIPANMEGQERCFVEYKALSFLSQKPTPNVLHAIPVGQFKYKGFDCFIQTAIYGQLMLNDLPLLRKTPNVNQFYFVTDHLIAIYRHTRQPVPHKASSYSLCFQHGDLWIGNLGYDQNNIVLYDLEFSKTNGKPLYDLIYFGIYYHRVVSNIGKVGRQIVIGHSGEQVDRRVFKLTPSDIKSVLVEPSPYSKIMKDCLRQYIKSCDIQEGDAVQLIYDYIVEEQQIQDLPKNWYRHIFD